MPLQLSPADLLGRVNRDVERSYLRARNGLRYVRGSNRPRLGTTPKDVVWQRDKAQLWRYRGGPVRFAQPLLIVTSLVSRSYILDLLPGAVRSSSCAIAASTSSCSTGGSPTSWTPTTASRRTWTSTSRAPCLRCGG